MEDRDRVSGTARIAFPGDPNLLILGVGDERQVDIEHDVEKHGDAGSDGHQLQQHEREQRAQPDYRVLPAVKHDPHLGWGSFNVERHGPLENANLRPIWNPQRCDWALRNQEGHPWQAGLFNGVALLAAAGGRVNALLDDIKKLPAAISPLIVAPYGGEKSPEA